MKRPTSLLLFAVLLAACLPSPALTPPDALTPAPSPTGRGEFTPAPTATITFTPTPKGLLDSLDLPPELAAALKKHPGLEASIISNADGTFTAQAVLLSPEGIADPAPLEVDPSTLTENLALIGKNKYADTPVMLARDGTKLYWIQEYKTWYAKTGEGSIHNPWRVPYGRAEVSARMTIADHPEDFPQAAVERWSKHQYQNALGFQMLRQSSRNAWVRMGYLDNMSLGDPDLTQENTPVQILAHDWYAMEFPDGSLFRYFPLKWLDPKDPRNPKPDEWKIIQAAPGTEITDNEYNRGQFLKLLEWTNNNAPVYRVIPIFKTDEGFFDYATHVVDFALILQPSLAKLLDEVDDRFASLRIPIFAEPGEFNWKYETWINYWWERISKDSGGSSAFENTDTQYYDDELFSQQFQTFIFPAFVMRRTP